MVPRLFLLAIPFFLASCGMQEGSSESNNPNHSLGENAAIKADLSLKEIDGPASLGQSFASDFFCVPGRGVHYLDMTKGAFDNAGFLFSEYGTLIGLNYKTKKKIDTESDNPGSELFAGLLDQEPLEYSAEFIPKDIMRDILPDDVEKMVCNESLDENNMCQDHYNVILWYADADERLSACTKKANGVLAESRIFASTADSIALTPYFNIDLAHASAARSDHIKLTPDRSGIIFDIEGNRYDDKAVDEKGRRIAISISGGVYGNNHSDDKDSDLDGISNKDEREIYGTDPFNADGDGDLLPDSDEIFVHKTDPNLLDTNAHEIVGDSIDMGGLLISDLSRTQTIDQALEKIVEEYDRYILEEKEKAYERELLKEEELAADQDDISRDTTSDDTLTNRDESTLDGTTEPITKEEEDPISDEPVSDEDRDSSTTPNDPVLEPVKSEPIDDIDDDGDLYSDSLKEEYYRDLQNSLDSTLTR